MDINSIKAAARARYGMEITDEQARRWLGSHPSGELTDDELDNVTGGCGEAMDKRVDDMAIAMRKKCPSCGSRLFQTTNVLNPSDMFNVGCVNKNCGKVYRVLAGGELRERSTL
ncbi:MAG: hypothetical protein LBS19_11090 [Clostridiales bacterium]|jgi:hypothetical protein|nr:hypothetical protein [Clostridiales bacterium]